MTTYSKIIPSSPSFVVAYSSPNCHTAETQRDSVPYETCAASDTPTGPVDKRNVEMSDDLPAAAVAAGYRHHAREEMSSAASGPIKRLCLDFADGRVSTEHLCCALCTHERCVVCRYLQRKHPAHSAWQADETLSGCCNHSPAAYMALSDKS